jgi:2-oxo-4-hydroxy-4-carboxy-5-ureidoimidazoline decarboxylase
MTLAELNGLEPRRAAAEFMRCCGSSRWAAEMTASRPFASLDAMCSRGDAIWASIDKGDWLDAFAAHPRIGEQRPVSAWSSSEQSGMQSAGEVTKARLATLNAAYEARFGYIFIVCATGKPAADMLTLLDARMANDPSIELPIAAEEQRKITGLRLAKLVDAHA